jgi:hypothetical protein
MNTIKKNEDNTSVFEQINIHLATGSPLFCPYSGINLMQDLDEINVPENLLLAIHWDIPDNPIYIKEAIENEFMEKLQECDYDLNATLKILDNLFYEFAGLIIINVTTGDKNSVLSENVTYVVANVI